MKTILMLLLGFFILLWGTPALLNAQSTVLQILGLAMGIGYLYKAVPFFLKQIAHFRAMSK